MWEELGISGGTAIILIFVFYFIIKWAVKNGIEEAYRNITGNKTYDDEEEDKLIESWEKEEQEKKQKSKKKGK